MKPQPAYSLVPRLVTPRIDPGENIDIDLFFSGYGIVKANKLFVQYPRSILNLENPGYVEYCIKSSTDRDGKISPLSGKRVLERHDMTIEGLIVVMNEGYFLDKPGTYPKNAVPIIMSENVWDGYPPFKFILNTSNDTKPGNYNITFVFTYCDEQNYYTDYKTIEIHINNWIERNQKKIQIIASILAIIALGATLIQTVYTVLQYYARAP